MTALPVRHLETTAVPRLASIDSESAIYRNGVYLENNPSWHIEESPFKVRQIQRMMKRQRETEPKTVCDGRLRRRHGSSRTATASSF